MAEYVVKRGDTLGSIAQRVFGSSARWRDLGYTGNPARLQVGTTLRWGGTAAPAAAPQLGTPAGFTPPNPTPWVTPEERTRITQKYGAGMAAYLSNGEVGPILADAIRTNLSPDELQQRLGATQLYQTTQASVRDWRVKKIEDPATAQAKIREQYNKTRDYARSLGISIPDDLLTQISEDALSMGWDEGQLADIIAGYFKFDPNNAEPLGTVGLDMAGIKRMGAQFLIDIADQEAFNWSVQIAKGEMKADSLEIVMRTRSKARFPHLAQQIDDGITPADVFAEQKNAIARVMEIGVDQVDLIRDERWMKTLDFVDSQGKRRPMTVTEAMEHARTTPEWMETRQANQKAAGLEMFLLQNLGKLPGAA